MHGDRLAVDDVIINAPLIFVIAVHVVGDKDEIAEDLVYAGDQLALSRAHGDVIAADENDVGVVDERPAVQLAAEDGVVHAVDRGDALAVQFFLRGQIHPFEPDVRARAAEIHLSESRPKGHAATENELVSDDLAQKIHAVAHDLAA